MLSVFKTIFFLIISPFRTVYNWLFRRRLQKLYEPSSPPNSANNIQPNDNTSHHIVDFDQSWSNNDWGGMENEANVSQTELYRNQLIRQRSESTSQPASSVEAEVNFFADMEPQSVRQAKVYVGSNSYSDNRSRLSVSNDEAYQPIPETVSQTNKQACSVYF